MNNTPWPTTVPILSVAQNVAQQYGSPYEDGYPTDTLAWVEYSFPNHSHRVEFWKQHYKVYMVFEKERQRILTILNILNEKQHIEKWNIRVRAIWNTAMVLLGYTEGQSDKVLALYEYLISNSFFQKLDVLVGCRNGIYYPIAYYEDNVEITMNKAVTVTKGETIYAKEETNTEYITRSNVNRITDTTRQRNQTSRRKPTRPSTIYKGNPALKRLMQAD